MSRNKHRAPRRRLEGPEVSARPAPATRSGRQPFLWIGLILLVGVGAGWLVWRRVPTPVIPTISTGRLGPESAALIEKDLDEVRAAPRSGPAWGKLGAVLKSFEYREEARRCFETAERFDPAEPRW